MMAQQAHDTYTEQDGGSGPVIPWLEEIRRKDSEAITGMTPDEIVAYYQSQLALLREQQDDEEGR